MSAHDGEINNLLKDLRRDPLKQTAWGRLYELVSPRLRLYTFSFIRSNGGIATYEADDIVQAVLIRFVQNFPRYESNIESGQHLVNYLIKACRNEAANRLRHANVQESARDFLELRITDVLSQRSASLLQAVENKQLLEQLLNQIGPQCQKLIRYYLLDEGTLSEYASQGAMPEGTVYSQWHRCLNELRSLLKSVKSAP